VIPVEFRVQPVVVREQPVIDKVDPVKFRLQPDIDKVDPVDVRMAARRFSQTRAPGKRVCSARPHFPLSLTVQDKISGYLTGTLNTATGAVPLTGFTDTGAGADGLTLQGLTVAALLPGAHMVVAIAGSLNLATNSLTMSWLESNGTAAGSTYTQTRFAGVGFCAGMSFPSAFGVITYAGTTRR